MDDEQKIFETVATTAQRCFEQHPVIVLGSGASIPHRLRGMGELAKYLIDNIAPDDEKENEAWVLIRTALANGDGLEEALLKTAAPLSLVRKIVQLTWQAIADDDLALMNRAVLGEEKFSLSDLLRGMFKSTHRTVNIVTPNYDRVAEYASDISGFFHCCGFHPGIIRARNSEETISLRRGNSFARTVKIWKVHGSLDWFCDQTGRVMCLPIPERLPENFDPLIVTPGVSKYERTHDEPFRSAIQGADAALTQAASFLCVGYGFRDSHIQPKIVDRCRQQNIPIVILARTLTDEARQFLTNNAGAAYMALEKEGEGTRVYTPRIQKGAL